MRFKLMMMLIAAFAVAGLTACQNATTNTQTGTTNTQTGNRAAAEQPKNAAPKTDEHGHADDAPRISLADAKKDFDAGNVVFIDTRAEAAFKQEHVKGAINVPMESFEAKFKDIPTGKKIIAYCS